MKTRTAHAERVDQAPSAFEKNLLRPLRLSEGFIGTKLSRCLTSEPGRYVAPTVPHFLTFSPSSTSRRSTVNPNGHLLRREAFVGDPV
jgi:hypothetical protein